MSKAQPPVPHESTFESIKHIGVDGQEYWSARELYPILNYKHWQDFYNVLKEAMTVYRKSGGDPASIFREVSKATSRKSGRPYRGFRSKWTKTGSYSKSVVSPTVRPYYFIVTRHKVHVFEVSQTLLVHTYCA